MPDAAAARDLRALTDRNGSGNVSDLLREGVALHRRARRAVGRRVRQRAVGADGDHRRERPGWPGRRRGVLPTSTGWPPTAWLSPSPRSPGSDVDRLVVAIRTREPGAGRRSGGGGGHGHRRPAARAIAGRGSRPALCGVELISPKTACARARQAAASAPGCSRASTRHPDLHVAALQPAHLRGVVVGQRAQVAVLHGDQRRVVQREVDLEARSARAAGAAGRPRPRRPPARCRPRAAAR